MPLSCYDRESMEESDVPLAGTIQIRSGCWKWVAQRERVGSRIHFRRAESRSEEMQGWVPTWDLTPQIVQEAAADPLYRILTDSRGDSWRVSLESPSLPCSRRKLFKECLVLVFAGPSIRREAEVSITTALGEFTREELESLLGTAIRPPRN